MSLKSLKIVQNAHITEKASHYFQKSLNFSAKALKKNQNLYKSLKISLKYHLFLKTKKPVSL
jgi:hypothetical protein